MCGALRAVTLPDTVEHLTAKPFYECRALLGIRYLWRGTKMPYVWVPFTPRGRKLICQMQQGIFTWQQYDEMFPAWRTKQQKITVACWRLRFREGLSDEAQAQYRAYIKRYALETARQAIEKEDMERLSLLCEEKLLPKRHLPALIALSSKGQGLSTAMLLEYGKTQVHPPAKRRFQL